MVALCQFLPGPASSQVGVALGYGRADLAGALVFGGVHVVLPLLQAEVVPHGWIDNDTFMAGYGAAQAVPGRLFTFAAFVGTAIASTAGQGGWIGGLLALERFLCRPACS